MTTEKDQVRLEVSGVDDISGVDFNDSLGTWDKFKDSFKRQCFEQGQGGKILAKEIKTRHLAVMALLTGIGTGLLVGTGKVLSLSGPLFLIIGYIVVGSFLYPTLQAAGEMAVNYSQLSGGYNSYPRKFVDESVSFAITWNYFLEWISTLALELVTASITIKYWNTNINPAVWVSIFYLVVLVINFIGARGYGEGEFIFGSTKLIMIVGFIIMAIVINVGGGPNHEFIGAKFWHEPGFYTNFKGLCNVFVTGTFSFGQSEFIALSAAEQPNPRKAIPFAFRLIFWRIIIIYLGSLIMVGLLVPYNSPDLMGAGHNTNSSPYVLAAEMHGVKVAASIINVVILFSVASTASSSLYSASRVLQSLSEQGFAFKYFNYIDKSGRPLRALVACSFIGLFSFIAAYEKEDQVFTWLLSISGLAQLFTFDIICVSHLRFRQALRYNKIPIESLGYISSTGVWGSVYAIILHWLILIAQFWIALFPEGSSKPDIRNFFENYLASCVVLLFYVGHKVWTKNWKLFIQTKNIDIHSDRVLFDQEILKLEREENKEIYENSNWYRRIFRILI